MFSPRLYELAQDSEPLMIQLSEYVDENAGDEVSLTVALTEEQASWIEFDADYRLFTIRPNALTPLNYSFVPVILDDQKTQTEQRLDFWITTADDEIEEPVEEEEPEEKEPSEEDDDAEEEE